MADITAARLNNLQSRIALILGTGSGSSGYGQSLASSQVVADSIVASSDINNIFTDMVKARIHQVGIAETGIRQVIEDLNIIAEDTSGTITDAGVEGSDVEGTKKGLADYESLMNNIESDKLLLHSSQAALEPKLTSTRTATWNGLIYHVFTATWSSADVRRHFFNAGGEIRLSTNNTNPSTSKGLDWAALCSEVGIVRFTRSQTFAGNSGQGYFIGDDYMSSSYQTVYAKVGAGTYSGVYAGNLYTIKARETSSSVIEFRIEFNDVVVDNNIDNNVDGALTSTIQQYRADGPNSITSVSPTFYSSTSLPGFNIPVDVSIPTYILYVRRGFVMLLGAPDHSGWSLQKYKQMTNIEKVEETGKCLKPAHIYTFEIIKIDEHHQHISFLETRKKTCVEKPQNKHCLTAPHVCYGAFLEQTR